MHVQLIEIVRRTDQKNLRNDPIVIGLVDADLLVGGTRHPNLALLKIAGFLKGNNIQVRLLDNPNPTQEYIEQFNHIFISRVFTSTKLPKLYKIAYENKDPKFSFGGTGFYATKSLSEGFEEERNKDMNRLANDSYLNTLPNNYKAIDPNYQGSEYGIEMAHQKPFYDLYKDYIDKTIESKLKLEEEKPEGKRKTREYFKGYFKDYLYFSIGFLTRGCFRKCPFCVNRTCSDVTEYSKLDWFLDKDEEGNLKRPYVYLWDDNFFAADRSIWEPALKELNNLKIPFQFRQGLDERLIAKGPDGKVWDDGIEIARQLSQSHYYGDFIFAFDNWSDRETIEIALQRWRKFVPTHPTKFYLFCGFHQAKEKERWFFKDIWEIFHRIRILMYYGCLGYIMRHEDYKKAPIPNFYVQVARWCNQPAFYKKMSFWQFCYRNQSYWEESKGIKVPEAEKLISYEEYIQKKEAGYYKQNGISICMPLRTIEEILKKFPSQTDLLLEMFNYRMVDIKQIPKEEWVIDPDPDPKTLNL